MSSERGHSTGKHTYEGDAGGYDWALTAVVASWWRSVESGSIRDIALVVGSCGNYMATEDGHFTASVAELGKLRHAIAKLSFVSPSVRDRARAILKELSPLEDEAIKSESDLAAWRAKFDPRR